MNEHTVLEESGICIYGSEIDKLYYKRFGIQPMDPKYLKSLLGQPSAEKYTILIAHNPDYFPKYADWGADLVRLCLRPFSAMILVSLRDCGIPCFTAYRLFAMQALICSA